MQDVAELLLKTLVGKPEAVSVSVSREQDGVRLLAHVDPADVARVIGRQGRTINAIRTVIRAAGIKEDLPVYFDLDEDERA